jgi:hypothetical protein
LEWKIFYSHQLTNFMCSIQNVILFIFSFSLSLTYKYICIYVCIYMWIYIYYLHRLSPQPFACRTPFLFTWWSTRYNWPNLIEEHCKGIIRENWETSDFVLLSLPSPKETLYMKNCRTKSFPSSSQE